MHKAIQHKTKWIGGSLILFVLAVFTFSNMGGEFIPELEEGDFAVDTRVLTGSNLQTTIASTQQAAKILLDEFPEVEKVVTKIGSGEIPTDPMPIEASDLMIILKDKKEWTSAKTFDELAEKMGARMASVPGITTGFQFPVQMRFNELMTGARQDVVCKIYGENLDTLSDYASQLGSIINTIDGAKDLYVETVSGMPQIVVNYKREELARYGIAIDQVNAMVEAAFAGKVTGQVYEGEKRFDLAVKLDTTQRKSLQNVQQLLIDAPSGMKLPLSSIANVEIVNGPYQIQRDNTRRRIIVGFNVRGRDVESIVTELQQKVKDKLSLPSGYSMTYGGAFENLQQAVSRLMIAVPIALLLILLLLYFAFKSIGQSLLIYSAIPLSAIGGVFALWLRDLPFSISAGVGFIALFGVAVLNGIVLLSEINRLHHQGDKTAMQCVMEATKSRLRPVLMTASVASLGFLPMALSNGAGAEVQRPLATVVIGGLLTATVLTLFVLPMLYLLFQNRKERKMSIHKITSVMIIGLFVSSFAHAQDSVELEALVLKATNESVAIQAMQKKVEEYETLANIKAALDATNISAEYGQVNSAAMDHRLVVDQSINSMKLYKAQRERYLLLAKENAILLDAEKKKIRQVIEENYYHTLILLQQEKLLSNSIQNMEIAVDKMRLRFEKGESAAWEVSMLEEQLWKLHNRLTSVKQQMVVSTANIQAYLPDFDYANVQSTWQKPGLMDKLDASQLSKNENVLLETNRIELVKNDRSSIVGQRLPVYHLGVAAMTIKGYQNTEGYDVYYGNDSYFYTVQAGISIPLFGANKRKLQSNAVSLSAQTNQEWFALNKTQKDYDAVYFKATTLNQSIEQYEQRLSAAQSDWSSINLQLLEKGEISIVEWIALQQWRNDTQLEYLQTCLEYSTQLSILHTYSPIQ
ncbi:MAG: efflux RND transporter permease subunit [Flavobacteriales bacterium]